MKKRRRYIQPSTAGVRTTVRWGRRGGPVRVTVTIPRRRLAGRLSKKR